MDTIHHSGSVMRMESNSPKVPRTLAIDCGGGGIKSCLLSPDGFQIGHAQRTALRYPLSPGDLLSIIESHAEDLGTFDRITLGMPGMIRGGRVIYTPHYIRKAGPHTRIDPELEAAWNGLDMAGHLRDHFHVPALVMNDAEVAAAAVASGEGAELILTLGTGLGTAFIVDGTLAPHLEISHAPVRWGLTYDDYIGEAERIRLGDSAWSRRVVKMIESLQPVFRWDRLYLGGGNSARIKPAARARMPENVTFIPNAAGMNGGVRAWAFTRTAG